MPNMYDLKSDDVLGENGTVVKGGEGPIVTINNKKVPPVEDFNIDDVIEATVKFKVKGVKKPEFTQNEVKADEIIESRLELIEIGIDNLKPSRKKAERLGLSKDRYNKLQERRMKGVSEVS